ERSARMRTIPPLPMNQDAIKQYLPHRDPFLLIDEVLEIERGRRIVARKEVRHDEGVLAGHFPDNPVYPGVYMVEGLAQTAVILGCFNDGVAGCEDIFLT